MNLPGKYRGIVSQRAQRQAGGDEQDNGWLTTYGDLMTLVLVFFVLFYIFSITGQMPMLTGILTEYHMQRSGGYPMETLLDYQQMAAGGEMIISIPSQVLFDLGKAEIKPQALPYLRTAVDSLNRMLEFDPEAQVRIEGYTDDIPIHTWRFRNNWELSVARAISVVRYLIEIEQFPPDRLQAMGYGEYNPVAPNDTPENRQRNRRVEIKVVRSPRLEDALPPQVEPGEQDSPSSARELYRGARRAGRRVLNTVNGLLSGGGESGSHQDGGSEP
jgi:chemotaxis protein MotB